MEYVEFFLKMDLVVTVVSLVTMFVLMLLEVPIPGALVGVDETVRQQEDLHAQLGGHHIFGHIVAHHDTFLRMQAAFAEDFFIIA